jgi:hypothetical protein
VDHLARAHEKAVVFVDEIQRVPEVLDEIHHLMEVHKGRICFVLTGSSSRKLKRHASNLLGGRAWSFSLHPFTHDELGADFSLGRALRFGSLPPVCGEDSVARSSFRRSWMALRLGLCSRTRPAVTVVASLTSTSTRMTQSSGLVLISSQVNLSAMAHSTPSAGQCLRAQSVPLGPHP